MNDEIAGRPQHGSHTPEQPSINILRTAQTMRPMPDGLNLQTHVDTVDSHANALHARRPVSIAVDPVTLITTECITVTSAMRKHARWSQSSVSAILGGGGATRVYEQEISRPSTPRNGISVGRKISSRYEKSDSIAGEEPQSLASRWGLRGKKGKSMQDNPLMSAFARLRADLVGYRDIHTFDTPSLLHPFLQVIRSSSTSAPITSLALIAITKFFAYNLIGKDSPRLSLAMQLLSAAITHCRFEASDSSADEVVLLRILKLMEGMLSRPEGIVLGDESVCEMMETGLSMCCQARLSEVLRRSAEMAMVNMCQVIFERLKHIEVEDPTNLQSPLETRQEDATGLKMDPSVDGDTVTSHQSNLLAPEPGETSETDKSRPSDEGMTVTATNGENASGPSDEGSEEVAPYGLPSIRELFRVLIDLLDPHNRQHTDSMRVMALRIIDVALEIAGPSIAKHPSLAILAKDDLCRYLFQLVRSENVALLNGSLRVAGTLLTTCRDVLKLQQELYLSYLVACLHPRVEIPRESGIEPSLYDGVPQAPKLVRPPPSQTSSGRSTPVPVKDRQKLGMEGGSRKPDSREAMVENIGTLTRIPTFMVELFVNYDCEVDRADLCEDMIGLLSRNAFPDSATWSTTNVPPLCLDALLGYVNFVYERLDQTAHAGTLPSRQRLREQRARKKIIMKGASKFNEDPKSGIAYLASQGIIENPGDPRSVTKFLKSTSRISKKVLGDFISKKSNEQFLQAFIDLFDFSGKRIDEAVRELLGAFRLPGESPLIERIVTVFSEKYCATATPEGVADKDAILVLTYAIIMLNTDQHNPNVKSESRMAYADFAKNLRGVNGGSDFAPEYLQSIYDNIKHNEIIIPDEHDNKHAFEYAWKELLIKTEEAGDLVPCDTNAFDADMFSATWKPIVATLSYVFMSASDDAVFSRVVMGFHQCAQIAARYGIIEAFDRIVYSLISISTLASDPPPSTALNTEVQVGQKRVMVSELAVKFGRNFRAQLATAVLFRVLVGNEQVVRGHWNLITRVLLNLFVNSLIPSFPSKLAGDLDLPPIPLHTPSQVIDRDQRANESGFISTFTSYLSSYTADDPPEPSDEELDNTLSTVDCINSCSIDVLLTNILAMPLSSVYLLVSCLLSELPEESSPVVIVVKPERPNAPTPKMNGHRNPRNGPVYNPEMLWILELATLLTLRDRDTITNSGENLTAALQNVVRDAANLHPLIVSRAVYYLLNLLRSSHDLPFMRAPVVLHSISSFDQEKLDTAALPVLKGLYLCMSSSDPLRNEITSSPDFWSVLQRLIKHKEGAELVFKLLQNIVDSTPSAVTADNYESTVSLANDFATAGSAGAKLEQRRDAAPRGKRGAKPPPPNPKENEEVIRGAKAIGIVYQMTSRISNLIQQSHLERNEAWAAYWSPIFGSLTTQCVNPCREIRHQAISALQRSLLSPDLASPGHTEWIAIFSEVLFPLILRLLKPEIYQSDPLGMSETRVQAATLVCRIFLHYLVLLSEWDGMLDLWLKILDILDRMMNSGQSDSLDEAVPESLKNILLVMANGQYLVPPSEDPSKEKLWVETRKRLERFLPDLFDEVFPPPPPTEENKPDEEEASESRARSNEKMEGQEGTDAAAKTARLD